MIDIPTLAACMKAPIPWYQFFYMIGMTTLLVTIVFMAGRNSRDRWK